MFLKEHDLWKQQIKANPYVVSSRLGDEGVLVHLRTSHIFGLNATGLRIWELAGEGCDLGMIEQTLQKEFDVEPERLRSELLAIVDEFSREGLLDGRGRR